MERLGQQKRGRAAVLALSLLLAACGSNSDKPQPSSENKVPKRPTAVQLAHREGGVVSEYPGYENELLDTVRYCEEIDGKVVAIADTPDYPVVHCEIAGTDVAASANRSDDSVLKEMCALAGGTVLGVAIEAGNSFNVPACHIPKPA